MADDTRALLREYYKRFGDRPEEATVEHGARTYRWREDMFEQQKALIDDPMKQKAAVTSRRAGKTYTVSRYLLEVAYKHPECLVVYIGLTRSAAKRLMWTELKRANRRYSLNINFNNADLVATLPNHSQIMLTGVNDSADVDKLRGSSFRLVCIDECQSYGPFLPELIEEVLEPALIDTQGTLLLTGTPNASCHGLFYDVTTNPKMGWSVHRWTLRENPHIPHAQEYLDKKLATKGWDLNNPVFQREWCGKWVKSNDSLVYKYGTHNLVDDLPDNEWRFLLGVDIGFHDRTALAIGCYCDNDPSLYIMDTPAFSRLTPSEIAEKIHELNDFYEFEAIVADTGGLGRSIVEDWRTRFGLPIQAAEKTKKAAFIEMMNDDLKRGLLKVAKTAEVINEWDVLQWHDMGLREDPRYLNDCSDAALYMYRLSRHFVTPNEASPPAPGDAGYWDYIEKELESKALERLHAVDDMPWWAKNIELN